MAALKPGTPERGWNDPPAFDFAASSSKQARPRKNVLNKRVAFPMSSETPENSEKPRILLNPETGPPTLGTIHLLPPAHNTDTPSPLPLLVPNLSGSHAAIDSLKKDTCGTELKEASMSSKEAIDKLMEKLTLRSDEELLKFLLENMQSVFEKCKACLQIRAIEDVNRKLNFFEDCWNKGQLSDAVKIKMTHLTIALKDGHCDIAHEIHLTLMVDHTAEVNLWMVGIKRIIQEAMKCQPSAGDHSGNAVPRTSFHGMETTSFMQEESHFSQKAMAANVGIPMVVSSPVLPEDSDSPQAAAAAAADGTKETGS